MTAYQLIITGLVLVSAPFAIRATWRLWRLWHRDADRSLLLLGFWVVALIVTVAGTWIGVLSLCRLLGIDALGWTAPITGILTVVVLQVPIILDGLVQRVAHQPDQPDNIGRGPR